MIEHSASISAISKALFTFQGAVDGVEKNKTNPGFKSRYANLEAVRDTAVPELQKVGIVFMQSPGAIVDGVMAMTTMLVHPESGEWFKMTGDIVLGKRDPQGVGSAMTYMQRYSLMAALGLPPVDDDGQSAMEQPKQSSRRPEPPKPTSERKSVEDSYDLAQNIDFQMETAKDLGQLTAIWKANWTAIQTLNLDVEKALTTKKDALKGTLPK